MADKSDPGKPQGGRRTPRWVLVHRGRFGLWWWRRSYKGTGVEFFGHLPRRSEYAAKCAAERAVRTAPTPEFVEAEF